MALDAGFDGSSDTGRIRHPQPSSAPEGFTAIERAADLYFRSESAWGGERLLSTESIGIVLFNAGYTTMQSLVNDIQPGAEVSISPEEATKMVLLTQHYDTVTAVGAHGKATVMMIPYTPEGMISIGDQIMQALLATDAAAKPPVSEADEPSPTA